MRGKWKERSKDKDGKKEGDGDAMSTDGSDESEVDEKKGKAQTKVTPKPALSTVKPQSNVTLERDPPPHLRNRSDPPSTAASKSASLSSTPSKNPPNSSPPVPAKLPQPASNKATANSMVVDNDDALESLTSNMTTLSLVPRSVKFGRGKMAGLGHK